MNQITTLLLPIYQINYSNSTYLNLTYSRSNTNYSVSRTNTTRNNYSTSDYNTSTTTITADVNEISDIDVSKINSLPSK